MYDAFMDLFDCLPLMATVSATSEDNIDRKVDFPYISQVMCSSYSYAELLLFIAVVN